MTQPQAGDGGRIVGKSLLTLANVITAVAPLAADWNDSHIFNGRWPGHARFHGVTALAMTTTLSSANIWSVWSGDGSQAAARFFAAAVPVAAHRRDVSSATMSAAGWVCFASATLCPAHSDSASMSPVVPSTGSADE